MMTLIISGAFPASSPKSINKEEQWNHGARSHFQEQYEGMPPANASSLILPTILGSSSRVLCSMAFEIQEMLNHSVSLFSLCSTESDPLNNANAEIQPDPGAVSTQLKALLAPDLFFGG